ncbi:hypothetical protein KIH79_07025 [Bifidobacterium sp. 82T10]|uniref:Uncharacterized protein n=1 Tax=Bifidobacterium miconis TaxID=2834435 RepID=A0ABS6WFA5_9BIFI|nr:hypothetical protein [Bifidobacterium miconis]MBW3092703.1 hypothetical protein [Bifidobacterium miconis]
MSDDMTSNDMQNTAADGTQAVPAAAKTAGKPAGGTFGFNPVASIMGVIGRLLMVPYSMLVVFAAVAGGVIAFTFLTEIVPNLNVFGRTMKAWGYSTNLWISHTLNPIASEMAAANPDDMWSRRYLELNPNGSLSFDGAEMGYVILGSVQGIIRLLWWAFSKYAIICVVPFVVLIFRHWRRPVRGYLDCLVWPAKVWTRLVTGKVGKLFLLGTGAVILANVLGAALWGAAFLLAYIETGSGTAVFTGLTWIVAGPIRILRWGNQYASGIRGATGGGAFDPILWLLYVVLFLAIIVSAVAAIAALADMVVWGLLSLPVTLLVLGYMASHHMIGDPHTVLWGALEAWVVWWLVASVIISAVVCLVPYYVGLVLGFGGDDVEPEAASSVGLATGRSVPGRSVGEVSDGGGAEADAPDVSAEPISSKPTVDVWIDAVCEAWYDENMQSVTELESKVGGMHGWVRAQRDWIRHPDGEYKGMERERQQWAAYMATDDGAAYAQWFEHAAGMVDDVVRDATAMAYAGMTDLRDTLRRMSDGHDEWFAGEAPDGSQSDASPDSQDAVDNRDQLVEVALFTMPATFGWIKSGHPIDYASAVADMIINAVDDPPAAGDLPNVRLADVMTLAQPEDIPEYCTAMRQTLSDIISGKE